MDLDLTFERVYPHPIDAVWEAIATREGLASWLMENDFEPEIGRPFQLRFCDQEGGDHTRPVFARLLEMEPPRRIVWDWRNEQESEVTRVEITLSECEGGTRVVLRHRGPISQETGGALEKGWPRKLASLGEVLGA